MFKEYLLNELFMMVEQNLGRPLSPTDQKILYGLYDWLNMPIDLIEYLFEYCLSRNHKQLSYIEKVAISWNDSEIKSVEEAKLQTIKNKDHFTILKRLGMTTAVITPIQQKYFDKWIKEYALPLDVILEGCNRAVANTQKPNLNYLDKILATWYQQGVKTIEGIVSAEQTYQLAKKQPQSKPKEVVEIKSKTQPFYSMPSHNWDYQEIARLERQYHERIRQGGTG